jgi:ketosteroid isomerase-like protein
MRKLILLLLFLTPAFLNGQDLDLNNKQVQKIMKKVAAFSEKVVAADYKGLTALYSEDARLFPPGKDIIAGEEAILNYWTLPEGVSIIHHKISPVEIVVKGKKAYDYGRYEGKTKLKDGSVTDWKGKYVIVWKREGKEWRIYLDSWSRID